MKKQRAVIGILGLTAVGIAIGAVSALLVRRRSPLLPAQAVAPPPVLGDAPGSDALPLVATSLGASPLFAGIDPIDSVFDDLPPDSTVFEPEPLSDPNITARPHDYTHPSLSANDYEAISADDLGAAYLARATDSSSDEADDDPSSLDEIPGFRIVRIN